MKRKTLFKIIILLFLLWVVMLGILYVTSGKYLEHAIRILKKQLDQHLITEININRQDIGFTLLRSFPSVGIELNNILIKSAPGLHREDFPLQDVDTLLYAGKISLTFNLRSLFDNDYQVKKVMIENAKLRLLSDKIGNVNYKILKTSSNDTLQDTVRFDLRKVICDKIQINYVDAKSGLSYSGFISGAEMKGSFISNNFLIETRIKSENNNLRLQKSIYLSKEMVSMNIVFGKRAGVYTLKRGGISIFGVNLRTEGKYSTVSKEYTLSLSCEAMPLQNVKSTLLYLWPGSVMLPQKGDLTLNGKISGKGALGPAISVKFKVNDGILRDRNKKVRVTDFYSQGYYTNGAKMNKVTSFLRIDSLSARSGKSILFMSGTVQNFIEPVFEGKARGYIELEKLLVIDKVAKKFRFNGMVKGNVRTNGHISPVRVNGRFDLSRVFLQGTLQFEDAFIQPLMNSIPASTISGIIKIRSLEEIGLEDISIRTGRSDLQVKGIVSHLPFFSSDKSVFPVYKCTVKSDKFHAEDLLPGYPEGKKELLKITFPDSLIVNADISMNNFTFGKFKATNVSGDFSYNPKVIRVSNLSMDSQKGNIHSDIKINQSMEKIYASGTAYFLHLDISDLFYAFNEFSQNVITHDFIDGYLSGSATTYTAWDLYLNPLYPELKINSQVTIDNGELINYAPLMGLSDYIAVEELKHIRFEKLQTNIDVAEERVIIGQMHINSSAISLTGSGEHKFDNSYVYRFQVSLSDVLWKKSRKKKPENAEFGYVVDDGLGRHIIPLAITGKDTAFQVVYDKKTAGSLFQEKLSKEKEVWQELIEPSDQPLDPNIQEEAIDWEDSHETVVDQDSSKDEEKKKDFVIEWEDE